MKKIVFVANSYKTSNFSTGGEKLNHILISEFAKRGYETKVLIEKNLTPDDIRLLEQERGNIILLSEQAWLPSDITYMHGHSFIFRISWMWSDFGFFFYKIFNRKGYLKRLKIYNRIKKNILSCKKVFVSSQVLKDDVVNNYGIDEKNVLIVPPPIEEYPEFLKSQNEVFTFGISAVGFSRKGGYLTLKAIKLLKKKCLNFKVKFIYPSKNKILNLLLKFYNIEKYCEFLPLQKNMGDFYGSIDCLLMPSLVEPFGMVATEALSVGVPVITALHCGAASHIRNGENGYCYDYTKKDEKGLVEAMEKMLVKTLEELNVMSLMCKETVKKQTVDDFVNKYIEVIDSLK